MKELGQKSVVFLQLQGTKQIAKDGFSDYVMSASQELDHEREQFFVTKWRTATSYFFTTAIRWRLPMEDRITTPDADMFTAIERLKRTYGGEAPPSTNQRR